jgi:hypothetical protein
MTRLFSTWTGQKNLVTVMFAALCQAISRVGYLPRRVNQMTTPANNQTANVTQRIAAARGSNSDALAPAFWKTKINPTTQTTQNSHS